ncbi:hypothetical protein SacN8_09770 [Sulfolobus acidocaldarius N8]|uniref:Uncharacterized protein n=2 Tax=Sulfolobus acidocaldarius TaxID=2285 RepID=M1J422_9CREN|nr:hypothetical protein SacN8_09770 [Sulfolobus acidocaldarius N8]AGE74184.1 hypothetical protein SacRon12I_09795 [Sulfolobus acidocaldarius Ron12/I]
MTYEKVKDLGIRLVLSSGQKINDEIGERIINLL